MSDLLNPDMSADTLRLHMGELTAQEIKTARAAIRWANTGVPPLPDIDKDPTGYHIKALEKLGYYVRCEITIKPIEPNEEKDGSYTQ